jgi:hypothetical protein
VKLKLKNPNLIFRKLNLSDYSKFRKLFYSCFKRDISLKFFKTRYFSDKFSFCYGVFDSSKLVANIGMHSMKLNNKYNERVFSRHSSMVLKKYRGKKIFSDLSNVVKKNLVKHIRFFVMWPNKNNFSNFGLENKKIVKKQYFLYEYCSFKRSKKITVNYPINKIATFKSYIENKKSFFLKNYIYFKMRYLSFKQKEYIINKFETKELKSFFILKYNMYKPKGNFVILDHFGSELIKSKHFSTLINENNKTIFLSDKKIKQKNYKFINYLYLKIAIIRDFNLRQKKNILKNKEIHLGDTDIFITLEKNEKKI